MTLDILSEKGQKTVEEEKKMMEYVSKCWNVTFKPTDKDKPLSHDSTMYYMNNMEGVCENKNRQITLEDLEGWGSWLVTYDKIERCRQIAKELKVPLYGFLGIELSKLVMFWKICDSEGNYLFEFDHHFSWTQETVNGGWVYRDNAYLPLEFGKFVQPNQNFKLL